MALREDSVALRRLPSCPKLYEIVNAAALGDFERMDGPRRVARGKRIAGVPT